MPALPDFGNVGADLSLAGGVAAGIGSLVAGQAAAAGDVAAAQGYSTEAKLYGEAAGVAGQNLQIERGTLQLQQYMNTRALRRTQADVRALTAGQGFQLSGSEQYILRQNATQGGIAAAVIGEQGAIQENAYQIQQTTLTGEAAQAQAAAQAAKIAAGAASAGGVLGLFGDIAKGAALLFA